MTEDERANPSCQHVEENGLLPPGADTTQVISENPRIVLSDTRYRNAPCFLYVPESQSDMVIVDYLPDLRNMTRWPLGSELRHPECARSFSAAGVPHKGVGVLATRPIREGELICVERPLWVSRRRLPCAADQTNMNGIFYRAAIQGLSLRTREIFFALENSFPSSHYDIVPGILNTNCLAIGTMPDPGNSPAPGLTCNEVDGYIGCFPTLSRVNHDCAPSAHYCFSFTSFCGELRATRDISTGEEITIAYVPLCTPGRERRALLAQTRHFECKCATCLLPVEEASASDARRVRIRELLKKLEGARFPPRVPMEELEESLRWTREENMRMEEARLLLCGSQVLTIYSDLDAAIQWARDARRVFELIEGKESMNLRKVDDADRVHQMMAAAPRTLRI